MLNKKYNYEDSLVEKTEYTGKYYLSPELESTIEKRINLVKNGAATFTELTDIKKHFKEIDLYIEELENN